MKVLLISLFHPELIRGGAQQVCYELFEGLREVPGIDVKLLASIDSSYPALFKSGARITGFDGRPNEFLFLSRDYDHQWSKAGNAFLIESFAEFLEIVQPDVVHFHHFLTLGVDLITLTRRVLPDCKIVFTLHEFMTICAANGHMVRKTDGSLCTHASPVRCHQCFPTQSPEHFFLREKWMKKHFEAIDVFTTPSKFMIERYERWGLDPKKMVHVTNGQANHNPDEFVVEREGPRNRFGFFGQLVDAKGIHVILEAVALLRASGFEDFVVEINGDNIRYASEAKRKLFEDFLAEEALRPEAERNVIFNGSYHVGQLKSRMSRIDWCIVPSVWEEIFCLVISEAWMFKRPVIGSNCGAMAERIVPEKNGLLFDVGDARDLARTMRRACEEEGLWGRISEAITPPPQRAQMVEKFCAVYENRVLANLEFV